MSDEKQSISNLFEKMPPAELKTVSVEFSKWYNDTVKSYQKDFDIDPAVGTQRDEMSEEAVLVFFREAIVWWQKQKPELPVSGHMSALQILKTRVCLGQIKSLTDRFAATGIELKNLNIVDSLY